MAGTTGLEPATSDVTGRRSNQLNYVPARLVSGPYPGTGAGLLTGIELFGQHHRQRMPHRR